MTLMMMRYSSLLSLSPATENRIKSSQVSRSMSFSTLYCRNPHALAQSIQSLVRYDVKVENIRERNVLLDLREIAPPGPSYHSHHLLLLESNTDSPNKMSSNLPILLLVPSLCHYEDGLEERGWQRLKKVWVEGKQVLSVTPLASASASASPVTFFLVEGEDLSPSVLASIYLQMLTDTEQEEKEKVQRLSSLGWKDFVEEEEEVVESGSNDVVDSIPRGQILPTILPSLLRGTGEAEGRGGYEVIYPNSAPISFSNDLFEGQAVIMVNTASMAEPFHSLFEGDKNTFEVQVQGRFKQNLEGKMLYVGAEITKKMELGLFTKGLCATILNFCRRYNNLLHHSFGDNNNIELPHITSPLWNTVDRLIITPNGEIPPPLLYRFPETEESRKKRKKDPNYAVEIDLQAIYSFSLKTAYLDLERWAVVNIPLMSTMNLQTFWADADLRFLAYAIDQKKCYGSGNGGGNGQKRHAVVDQQRLFSLEVQHVGNHPEWSGGSSLAFYANREANSLSSPPLPPLPSLASYCRVDDVVKPDEMEEEPEESSDDDEDDEDDHNEEEEGIDFFDAKDDHLESLPVLIQALPGRSDQLQDDMLMREVMEDISSKRELLLQNSNTGSLPIPALAALGGGGGGGGDGETTRSAAATTTINDIVQDDHWGVVAALEVEEQRPTLTARKRRVLYAFSKNGVVFALRSYKEIKTLLPVPTTSLQPSHYTRLSEVEQRRHSFDSLFRAIMSHRDSGYDGSRKKKLLSFLLHRQPQQQQQQQGERVEGESYSLIEDVLPSSTSSSTSSSGLLARRLSFSHYHHHHHHHQHSVLQESLCLLQEGNAYWCQMVIALTTQDLLLTKTTTTTTNRLFTGGIIANKQFRIPIDAILEVKAILQEEDCPLIIAEAKALLVATFSRQYLFLFHGEDVKEGWVDALTTMMMTHHGEGSSSSSSANEVVHSSANSVKVRSHHVITSSTSTSTSTSALVTGSSSSSHRHSKVHFLINANPEALLSYPKTWSLGDKAILNGRNYSLYGSLNLFHASTVPTSPGPSTTTSSGGDEGGRVGGGGGGGERWSWSRFVNEPVELSIWLLKTAFQLVQLTEDTTTTTTSSSSSSPSSVSKEAVVVVDLPEEICSLWLDFLDGLSLLQRVDLSHMDFASSHAACLFLNLYHTLVIHASLIIGLPTTLLKWQHFFRNFVYEGFGDIFSLAELEHCVIRKGKYDLIFL
eukprot:scaffold504_cov189-Ochromonas_danica.AAC.39